MLDRMEQDTVQLDSMLERILTVARLESGQLQPKFAPLVLNDVIDDVLHDAKFEAVATGAVINYAGSNPIEVTGDAGLLHSAVENLVRNAMFYSGRNGKIDVTLARLDGSAVITVRDNGPGVPESALPLLFKPFYRVDNSRGSATGGMGLGLAIVRNAVAIHGGTVVARNVSPHGLEVEMRLPVKPAPAGRRSSEFRLAHV